MRSVSFCSPLREMAFASLLSTWFPLLNLAVICVSKCGTEVWDRISNSSILSNEFSFHSRTYPDGRAQRTKDESSQAPLVPLFELDTISSPVSSTPSIRHGHRLQGSMLRTFYLQLPRFQKAHFAYWNRLEALLEVCQLP